MGEELRYPGPLLDMSGLYHVDQGALLSLRGCFAELTAIGELMLWRERAAATLHCIMNDTV